MINTVTAVSSAGIILKAVTGSVQSSVRLPLVLQQGGVEEEQKKMYPRKVSLCVLKNIKEPVRRETGYGVNPE